MHGFLNIDKPAGLTSTDVLRRLKRLLPKKSKIGHLGTLDPMATGVLPVALGNATRIISLIEKNHKRYQAGMCLGGVSDTEDAWGQVTLTGTTHFEIKHLNEILQEFTGSIAQVPPMYSALHHQGQRLYDLARQGIMVEREPRQITIYSIALLAVNQAGELPQVSLEVCCSPGTYVRSLCRDIGAKLGTGAYMNSLRRLADGPFGIEQAVALEDLLEGTTSLPQALLPLDYPLYAWPVHKLNSAEEEADLWHGKSLVVDYREDAPQVRIHNRQGDLAGVGRIQTCAGQGLLIPMRVFH